MLLFYSPHVPVLIYPFQRHTLLLDIRCTVKHLSTFLMGPSHCVHNYCFADAPSRTYFKHPQYGSWQRLQSFSRSVLDRFRFVSKPLDAFCIARTYCICHMIFTSLIIYIFKETNKLMYKLYNVHVSKNK